MNIKYEQKIVYDFIPLYFSVIDLLVYIDSILILDNIFFYCNMLMFMICEA